MTQLAFLPVAYLLDCSTLCTLDGRHWNDEPPAYQGEDYERVWTGIESLATLGRVKLIPHVKAELQLYNPEALRRLIRIRQHRVATRTASLVRLYQELLAKYPQMVRDPSRDPADPWLIAYARLNAGYVIVTEETPIVEAASSRARRRKLRNGPPLPDLCSEFQIRWTNLRGFVADEGLLGESAS